MGNVTPPKNLRRNKSNPYLLEWDDHEHGPKSFGYSVLMRPPATKANPYPGFESIGTLKQHERSVDIMKKRWMPRHPWCVIRIRTVTAFGAARGPDIFIGKGFPEGKKLDVSKLINQYSDHKERLRKLRNRHVHSWVRARNQRRTAAVNAHMNAQTACKIAYTACCQAIKTLDSRGVLPPGRAESISKAIKFAQKSSRDADKSNTKFPKPEKSKWTVMGIDRYINAEEWPDWDRTVPLLYFEGDGDIYLKHPSVGIVRENRFTWAMDGGTFESGTELDGAMKNDILEGRLNIQVTNSTFSAVFNIPKGTSTSKIVLPKPITEENYHEHEEKNDEVKEKIRKAQEVLEEVMQTFDEER